MGIIARQGFKGMISTYLGFVIGYINLIFIYPYFLEPSELGLMRIILDMGIVLGPLALLGSQRGVLKFYPDFEKNDPKSLGGLIPLYSIIVAVGIFTLSTLVFLNSSWFVKAFGKNMPELIQYIQLIPVLLSFVALRDFFDVLASVKGRIVVPSIFREIVLRFGFLISVVLFGLKVLDFNEMMYLIFTFYLINAIAGAVYISRLGVRFVGSFRFFLRKKNRLREFVDFSAFQIFLGFIAVFISKIDFFMLGAMKGAGSAGVYTIAFYIAIVVTIPHRALSQIANPIATKLTRQGNDMELKALYKDSSINMIVICGLLFLLIWINTDLLFEIMPNGEAYIAGKPVIFYVGVGYLISTASGVGGTILGYSKYYKFSILYSLIAFAIAIMSNLLLIPQFGIEGAAIGTLLTHVVLMLVVNGINYLKRGYGAFSIKSIYAFGILGLMFGLSYFLQPDINFYLLHIIKTLIIMPLGVFLIYRAKISSQLNEIIEKYVFTMFKS